MSKGKLIVLSGPSGVGKSTVIHRILENHPDFLFSVSATTRAPRAGEVPGKSYHYITEEQFKELMRQDAFLEYNHYAGGDYYGTPAQPIREVLEDGGVALLDVEPNGAFQVLERCPDAVTIFVAPPSMAELRRRLEGRKDTPPEKVAARIAHARWEIQQAERYQYLVINDDLELCVCKLEAVLAGLPEAQLCLYENNTDAYILKEVH